MGLMFFVHWLRVWISSFLPSHDLASMLSFLPKIIEPLMPVSYAQMATSAGKIAACYDDPIVLLLVTVWAISRGSDAVSGEVNRGTMEMVLAQPVTRLGVIGTHSATTLLGAVLISGAALFGTSLGLATISLEDAVSTSVFVPAAMNLLALTVFLAGLTTMVSSGSNYRSHTIGVVGGFFAISMILKVVGRMVPDWAWLTSTSFFTPFEPQLLVGDTRRAWIFWSATADGSFEIGGLGYDSILIGLGLACYLAAVAIFYRRDLPAPL
jgi:ABC-2 type transport system permease protein